MLLGGVRAHTCGYRQKWWSCCVAIKRLAMLLRAAVSRAWSLVQCVVMCSSVLQCVQALLHNKEEESCLPIQCPAKVWERGARSHLFSFTQTRQEVLWREISNKEYRTNGRDRFPLTFSRAHIHTHACMHTYICPYSSTYPHVHTNAVERLQSSNVAVGDRKHPRRLMDTRLEIQIEIEM